jgi:internalin A
VLTALAAGCDESKYDKYKTPPDAAPSAATELTQTLAGSIPRSETLPPPSSLPPVPRKRTASDCKPHPPAIEFDEPALEAEVRRKLGKDAGAIQPVELAQIRSINLANNRVHQIDPCVFPLFSSLKDLFLGPGDYDDLSPLQKLTTLEALRISLSPVKELHAIEGLKRLDRLDLSHTLVGDEELKSVSSLVNLTELMLDEDAITDLTPVASLKKLERLSIKKTQVKSLAPLSQLRTLRFVYIADTPITDLTPLQPLVSTGTRVVQN